MPFFVRVPFALLKRKEMRVTFALLNEGCSTMTYDP